MAWSIIRKANEDDYAAIKKSARRFCDRHNIRYDLEYEKPEDAINRKIQELLFRSDTEGAYLKMLWTRCIKRALGEPQAEGIAWEWIYRKTCGG